ncbi:hypothetical protein CSUI_008215, partial [Cystoisospora suis]
LHYFSCSSFRLPTFLRHSRRCFSDVVPFITRMVGF